MGTKGDNSNPPGEGASEDRRNLSLGIILLSYSLKPREN
jgi:hypothetical protein